jgi:hypothetical protein
MKFFQAWFVNPKKHATVPSFLCARRGHIFPHLFFISLSYKFCILYQMLRMFRNINESVNCDRACLILIITNND